MRMTAPPREQRGPRRASGGWERSARFSLRRLFGEALLDRSLLLDSRRAGGLSPEHETRRAREQPEETDALSWQGLAWMKNEADERGKQRERKEREREK